jgi:hypothetical protein
MVQIKRWVKAQETYKLKHILKEDKMTSVTWLSGYTDSRQRSKQVTHYTQFFSPCIILFDEVLWFSAFQDSETWITLHQP